VDLKGSRIKEWAYWIWHSALRNAMWNYLVNLISILNSLTSLNAAATIISKPRVNCPLIIIKSSFNGESNWDDDDDDDEEE
jgi:hypothetical protein